MCSCTWESMANEEDRGFGVGPMVESISGSMQEGKVSTHVVCAIKCRG